QNRTKKRLCIRCLKGKRIRAYSPDETHSLNVEVWSPRLNQQSQRDTIPASSQKAHTLWSDSERPKGAHMLACRQLVGIVTLAPRGSSPCPRFSYRAVYQVLPARRQA